MKKVPVKGRVDVALQQSSLMDAVEQRILDLGGARREAGGDVEGQPLVHRFTPGIYIREVTNPAGSFIVTNIHCTEHPFVISKGRCMVFDEDTGWTELSAPHTGITKPGTRRVIVVLEEMVWTTFHATDLTDLAEIERHVVASGHDHKKVGLR